MKYVISDIHGDFRHFREMLEKIRFSSADQMYILGDVVDKGKENLPALDLIRKTPGMLLIKGNHEYLCERYLAGTVSGELWDKCGGGGTRQEVDQERYLFSDDIHYIPGMPVP